MDSQDKWGVDDERRAARAKKGSRGDCTDHAVTSERQNKLSQRLSEGMGTANTGDDELLRKASVFYV